MIPMLAQLDPTWIFNAPTMEMIQIQNIINILFVVILVGFVTYAIKNSRAISNMQANHEARIQSLYDAHEKQVATRQQQNTDAHNLFTNTLRQYEQTLTLRDARIETLNNEYQEHLHQMIEFKTTYNNQAIDKENEIAGLHRKIDDMQLHFEQIYNELKGKYEALEQSHNQQLDSYKTIKAERDDYRKKYDTEYKTHLESKERERQANDKILDLTLQLTDLRATMIRLQSEHKTANLAKGQTHETPSDSDRAAIQPDSELSPAPDSTGR